MNDETETVISQEDLLRVKVVTLEMQNVQLQLQGMVGQLQTLKAREGQLVAEMGTLKAEFVQKYGVDLGTVQVGNDGRVVKPA
jgi:cell division protein FtsB